MPCLESHKKNSCYVIFYIYLSFLYETGHPNPSSEKTELRKAAHLTGLYLEDGLGKAFGRKQKSWLVSMTVLCSSWYFPVTVFETQE